MKVFDLLPPDGAYGNGGTGAAAITRHSPDIELRAIWRPIYTLRPGDPIDHLLAETRPFTVVHDEQLATPVTPSTVEPPGRGGSQPAAPSPAPTPKEESSD